MPEVFVDTSVWFETLHGGASRVHVAAQRDASRELQACRRAGTRIVTTNLVLAESHGLLCGRDGRGVARRFLSEVHAAGVTVVVSTSELERRAVDEWIDRFDDQPFSFTDAVSFTVMRARGIRRVLTFDRHFTVAGFDTLPA